MLETLTLDVFSPLVGQTFQVFLQPEQAVQLELVDARPLSEANTPRQRPPFMLMFKGPTQFVLPQRIYRFEHEAIGAHDIFVVPLGPGPGGGMMYEVIFN